MLAWLDPTSFFAGMIAGGALASATVAIRLRFFVSRTGDTKKTVQKNIAAGGDVIAGDKIDNSSE